MPVALTEPQTRGKRYLDIHTMVLIESGHDQLPNIPILRLGPTSFSHPCFLGLAWGEVAVINHSNCTHPSTSGARSKCRKARAAGSEYTAEGGATPKVVGMKSKDDVDRYGQTPRDRDKQCDVCGVEKIAWRGLDVLSGVVLYVGQRCYYYVKQDPDGPVALD